MPQCPYCGSVEPKCPIIYSAASREFFWCAACGVAFSVVPPQAHLELTQTVYGFGSWGNEFEQHLRVHGPRIDEILRWLTAAMPIAPHSRLLDVGAGSGLLIHKILQMPGADQLSVTAVEPVPMLAAWLTQKFPQCTIFGGDLESLDLVEQSMPPFDVVLCCGVDYLFQDINAALARIHSFTRVGSRVVFVRNVFLDMPCYFGGKEITTFSNLVDPNPLISLFMFPDQYLELIGRQFDVVRTHMFTEAYPPMRQHSPPDPKKTKIVAGRVLALEARGRPASVGARAPIRMPEQARKRLEVLGASFAA